MSRYAEQELLLCCARTRLSAAVADRIRTLANADIDWSYLFDLAAKHTVLTLVWRTLEAVVPDAVPVVIAEGVREQIDVRVMHGHVLAKELADVMRLMEGAGIRCLSLKGPTLAVKVYGDLSLREFFDLDLLVHPASFERACAVLQEYGYTLATHPGWQAAFVRGPVAIDLHRAVTQYAYAVPVDFDRWWDRRQVLEIDGTSLPTLSTEDLLLLLSIQAARDTWGWTLHLRKLCDIAETATRPGGLDWLVVETEARRLHVRWMLAFALQLAVRLLGAELPTAAARLSAGSRSVRSLAERESEDFLAERVLHPRSKLRGIAFHAQIRERLRDRLRPIWLNRRRLARLNARDRALVSLPRYLWPLYYALRPIRLLWAYGAPALFPYANTSLPRRDTREDGTGVS
jgi:Uncharacterised nucleotidyltransferase